MPKGALIAALIARSGDGQDTRAQKPRWRAGFGREDCNQLITDCPLQSVIVAMQVIVRRQDRRHHAGITGMAGRHAGPEGRCDPRPPA
jgi:hypothetical protein